VKAVQDKGCTVNRTIKKHGQDTERDNYPRSEKKKKLHPNWLLQRLASFVCRGSETWELGSFLANQQLHLQRPPRERFHYLFSHILLWINYIIFVFFNMILKLFFSAIAFFLPNLKAIE